MSGSLIKNNTHLLFVILQVCNFLYYHIASSPGLVGLFDFTHHAINARFIYANMYAGYPVAYNM